MNQSVTSVASMTSHASPIPNLRKQESQSTTSTSTGHGHGIQLQIPAMPSRQPSYKNLVDSPSPRSKLGERVVRLKQRCINSLGEELFHQAYEYLKQYALNHKDHINSNKASELDDDEDEDEDDFNKKEEQKKQRRIIEILGNHKAHYLPLLDQLIFMEEAHVQYQQQVK